MNTTPVEYSKKDFMSDQTIRWCPGCGDYSILSQVQTVFAGLGLAKEKYAIVSGIGCSSRFPYYMNTYGFHTIHGRATAVATGLKLTRPDLSVWVVTGDGDGLSIGGNHMAHLLRRNVDLNVLLFNNRIYGLTKGQYSPTSEIGKKTKSSPMGSIDHPFNPIAFALGCGSSYISRSVDVFAAHLRDTLTAANTHSGTSFVEILQNCNIFNDGAWDSMVDKEHRDGRVLYMEHGKPLVWGSEDNKYGFILDGLSIKPVKLGETYQETDCVLHDKHNLILATMLANLDPSDGAPLAVGTFYQSAKSTYDSMFSTQIADATSRLGAGDLAKLLNSGETWTV